MRIGIITGIFPPDIGGPATYVPTLATYLTERGHQVKVLAGSSCDFKDLVSDPKYSFELVRVDRSGNAGIQALKVIWRCLREFRSYDLLYSVGYFNQAALAAKLLRKPFAVKVMGDKAWERSLQRGLTHKGIDPFQQEKSSPAINLLKLLRSFSFLYADLVIAPSAYLKTLVRGWGVKETRIKLIYNAIETPHLEPHTRSATQSLIKVVSVGRLVSWKRFDLLIEAIAQTERVEATIIGDGEKRTELQQLVSRLNLKDRVHFSGSLSRSQTHATMQNSDLFVLCSEYEGLPHVVLEARMLGLPIIAADCGGTSEALENWPLSSLFQAGDLKTLSSLLQNASARPTSPQQDPNFLAKFRLETMLSETERALVGLASEGSGLESVRTTYAA